jgi:putative transcriptional regulator
VIILKIEVISHFDKLVKESGLKKGYIADKASVSKTTISNLSKGGMPELPVGYKIAAVMGKRIDEIWIPIIKREEEKNED